MDSTQHSYGEQAAQRARHHTEPVIAKKGNVSANVCDVQDKGRTVPMSHTVAYADVSTCRVSWRQESSFRGSGRFSFSHRDGAVRLFRFNDAELDSLLFSQRDSSDACDAMTS
jgi:hypothetical protein